jgi:hypothetical protein
MAMATVVETLDDVEQEVRRLRDEIADCGTLRAVQARAAERLQQTYSRLRMEKYALALYGLLRLDSEGLSGFQIRFAAALHEEAELRRKRLSTEARLESLEARMQQVASVLVR